MADELSGDIGGTTSSAPVTSPVADPSVASTQVSATTEPGVTEQTEATAGPIPFDRHRAILENARKKAAEEVESRYAHLKDIDPEGVRSYRSWTQMLELDPEGALDLLTRQLRRAGRLKDPATSQDTGKPQPDLRTEDGRFVYSAEQMERLLTWQEQRFEQRYRSELDPLKEELGQGRAEKQAIAEASREIADARANLPYFKEHEKEIAAAIVADKRLSIQGAYNRVVLPKIKQLERESVVKELTAKSNASTVNPSQARASTPRKYKTFAEGLAVEMAKLRGSS